MRRRLPALAIIALLIVGSFGSVMARGPVVSARLAADTCELSVRVNGVAVSVLNPEPIA